MHYKFSGLYDAWSSKFKSVLSPNVEKILYAVY